MSFRELISEFKISLSQDGYTATRKFVDTSYFPTPLQGGSEYAHIPFPGDSITDTPADNFPGLPLHGAFDNTFESEIDLTNLHVTNVECQPFEYKSHNIMAYVVTYGNAPAEDVRITTNLTVGTEVMTLDNEACKNGIKFLNDNRQIPYYYSKLISTAEYTVSETFDTFDLAVLSPVGYMSNYVGKVQPMFVNDGFWLFSGFDVNEHVMRNGQIKFKRTERYKYRRINDDNMTGLGGSSGGWNTIWNSFAKKWAQTDPLIYQLTSSSEDWPRLPMPLI